MTLGMGEGVDDHSATDSHTARKCTPPRGDFRHQRNCGDPAEAPRPIPAERDRRQGATNGGALGCWNLETTRGQRETVARRLPGLRPHHDRRHPSSRQSMVHGHESPAL